MSDKRSVATDALETLGTIIGEGAGRDAIHLAVEPVIASERLLAGQDVYLLPDGRAAKGKDKAVGIVDPFLKESVKPGEKFWLVVYPRQITSLRHVWSHPSFPEEAPATEITEEDRTQAEAVAKRLQGVTPSETWIREYADRMAVDYGELMDHAKDHAEHGSYWSEDRFEGESIPNGFWDHYETVTKQEVDPENRDNLFSCSC
jgi:hypothetical protein